MRSSLTNSSARRSSALAVAGLVRCAAGAAAAPSLPPALARTQLRPAAPASTCRWPKLQSIDVQPLPRTAAAADDAPVGTGTAAAVVHDRQARRASHSICPTPRSRCPRAASTSARGGVDTILAAGDQWTARAWCSISTSRCRTRRTSAATTSSSVGRGRPAQRLRPRRPPRPTMRQMAAGGGSSAPREHATPSTFAAARRRGRVIVQLSDPHTPMISLQQGAARSSSTSPAPTVPKNADASLRHARLRHAGLRASKSSASGNGARIVIGRERRFRAARLPVRRPVRGRGGAARKTSAAQE